MKYCWSQEVYRSGQEQFFNANFVWNQDEVSQNSRYAKRFYYSNSLALRQCNTSMIPDTHLLKLLFPTRYTSRSIYLCSYQSASSCRLTFWIYIAAIYYCDAPASLPFHKKTKHPHTMDKYSHKSNGKKILTVLRRNSIIIVNCSAEDI